MHAELHQGERVDRHLYMCKGKVRRARGCATEPRAITIGHWCNGQRETSNWALYSKAHRTMTGRAICMHTQFVYAIKWRCSPCCWLGGHTNSAADRVGLQQTE